MSVPRSRWDPQQYQFHASHRSRPFHDLLARVPELPPGPARVADLGCGTGALTALLAARWPGARVTGYDSSPQMLSAAPGGSAAPVAPGGSDAGTPPGPRPDLVRADLATWVPEEPHHLILSNAALHWVPSHPDLLPTWVAGLVRHGVLAFQVPGSHVQPSHTGLVELCTSPRWRDRLGPLMARFDPPPVLQPADYLARLTALDCSVDAWETTYLHLLTGPDPVLEWVKGSVLRPVLTALEDDPAERAEFLDSYREVLRAAYPPGPHGTTFPFRRVFVVARKEG